MNKLTAEWVRKAEVDWQVAQRLAAEKPRLNDPICFHCQQAVEKYLKALMQEYGLVAQRTHNLGMLLTQVLSLDQSLSRFRMRVDRLTDYAVDYRYPGIHATTRQSQSAMKTTTQLRGELRRLLGLTK